MKINMFDIIDSRDLLALAKKIEHEDLNAVDPQHLGWTLLKAAISEVSEGGPIDAVTLLLRGGADVNFTGQIGYSSPLLVAIDLGLLEIVRLLLGRGADISTKDDEGDFPLVLAVQKENIPIVQLLLHCGATVTVNDAGTPAGMTPLGIAVGRLNVEMVELLFNNGANPEVTDGNRLLAIGYLPRSSDANIDKRTRIVELFSYHTPK